MKRTWKKNRDEAKLQWKAHQRAAKKAWKHELKSQKERMRSWKHTFRRHKASLREQNPKCDDEAASPGNACDAAAATGAESGTALESTVLSNQSLAELEAQMASMGFANRELNAQLLAAHDGDINAVVAHLI